MAQVNFSIITTRGGDSGKSGLLGGERRFKSESIFAILGDIDELTSNLGLCRSASRHCAVDHGALHDDIRIIQEELQNIAALIATPISSVNSIKPLGRSDSEWVDYLRTKLEELEKIESHYIEYIHIDSFIIPGDTELSARLDVARTVCRRAERSCVRYMQELPTECYRLVQNYINRLSDCLFVMARYVEQSGQEQSARPKS